MADVAADAIRADARRGDDRHRRTGRPRIEPLFEPDPAASQVVMTRFECPNLLALVRLRLLHGRVGRDVRRHAAGFLGVRVVVDWPTRVMWSISLWEDLDSVYSMGDVPRHIVAARAPGRLGVRTTSGVFCFAGDWRHVMFRSPMPGVSPLHQVPDDQPPTGG
jgi:hypothetical protein